MFLTIRQEPIFNFLDLSQQVHPLHHPFQELSTNTFISFNRDEVDLLGEDFLADFVVAREAEHELLDGLGYLALHHCEVLGVYSYLTQQYFI